MFESILDLSTGTVPVADALICTGVSLILGLIISLAYMFKNGSATKSMAVSLVLLPLLVQTVIMMVNGNLGAGVAVLGAFSLVRFRSVPGSAKDICCIFAAMAVGLGCGMGYVAFAAMIGIIAALIQMVLFASSFGEKKDEYRELRIVVPETLDYVDAFDGVLQEYTRSCRLMQVKTTNLGSMFDLRYKVQLKNPADQKKLIDEIRTRNGNLTVSLGHWRGDGEVL